jgi:hypothetical protein
MFFNKWFYCRVAIYIIVSLLALSSQQQSMDIPWFVRLAITFIFPVVVYTYLLMNKSPDKIVDSKDILSFNSAFYPMNKYPINCWVMFANCIILGGLCVFLKNIFIFNKLNLDSLNDVFLGSGVLIAVYVFHRNQK